MVTTTQNYNKMKQKQ